MLPERCFNFITLLCCGFTLSVHGEAITFFKRKSNNNATSSVVNKHEIFLSRQKRYLHFQKGALATFTGNVGKAILPGGPRGINFLFEYTLLYDIPQSLNEVLLAQRQRKKMPKPTTTTVMPASVRKIWASRPKQQHWRDYMTRRQYSIRPKLQHRNSCAFRNAYTSFHKPKPWCRIAYQRRRTRSAEDEFATQPTDTFSEQLFMDLIGHLAAMHGLNARYCIMRILCESKFFLLPRGYSLFHDIVHVLLNNSMPAVERNKKFRLAFWQPNINQCSVLYGPHCRISFFDYFARNLEIGVNL